MTQSFFGNLFGNGSAHALLQEQLLQLIGATRSLQQGIKQGDQSAQLELGSLSGPLRELCQEFNTVLSLLGERLSNTLATISANQTLYDENLRVRKALDGASTNVMIADNNLDIVYMNEAVLAKLGQAESDIRKDLPNFDTRQLMGKNIDTFHKDPSHQRSMLAKLDKTFPTVDCSACILGPKMVDVAQHSNITLYAYSEVEDISGYVGNFTVKIRKRTTYVDWNLCTGCGACTEKCPAKKTPDTFNELTGTTTAITIAFPQAIPKKAVINPQFCRQLIKGKCGVCAKVCPTGAIKYDMEDEIITEEVGSIVAATGYDLMDWTVYKEYGGGAYPDVITSLQYERLLSASGPTGGHVKRPSDGREPKNIVFVQCVGSRDKSVGRPYCSGFCCMYTAKQAILTKDHIPDSRSYVFYMDIRAPGKMYDEFTRRAMEEYGTEYIRGRVSQIYPDGNGQMTVMGVDTLLGQPVEIKADLVVLAVGVEASKGSPQLAEKLRISYDSYGFFMESHVKLKPVETNTAGVYLAGVCQGVKDIPASVAQGSAAAAKVLSLFAKDKLESDPQIAQVDIRRCVNCGKCIRCCPFGAIKEVEIRGEGKAQVIETVCQGCGLCTATCPQGAIQLSHATDNQILAEVNALCQC